MMEPSDSGAIPAVDAAADRTARLPEVADTRTLPSPQLSSSLPLPSKRLLEKFRERPVKELLARFIAEHEGHRRVDVRKPAIVSGNVDAFLQCLK